VELPADVRTEQGHSVLAVTGDVDVYSAPALGRRLTGLLDSGERRLVVDLSGVDFLDSTGLGVLVAALNRCRDEGGSLSLVCSKPSILKLFAITGLDQVFVIHATVAGAAAG
jgi:anti-sigma B factor antagonist